MAYSKKKRSSRRGSAKIYRWPSRTAQPYKRNTKYWNAKKLGGTIRRKRGKIALHQFTLGQINPFDPDVKGVRVPDDNAAPSSAFFSYDENTITTSSTNACCSAFFPTASNYRVDSNNNIGTSSWTWGASFAGSYNSAQLSAITSTYNVTRPVAHGVRIYCPLAPTAATGYAHVCLYVFNTYGATTWALPTSISQMTELPYYTRISLASLTQTPYILTNKFCDMTAFRYTDAGSNDQGNTSVGQFNIPHQWMVILIAVEGAPSTSACLSCESIIHTEGQTKAGGLNLDQRACPVSNRVMEQTSRVGQRTSPIHPDTPDGNAQALREGIQAVGNAARNVAETIREVRAAYSDSRDYFSRVIAGGTIGTAMAMTNGILGVNDRNRGAAGIGEY